MAGTGTVCVGWGAAPWYGYYGAYFRPYPVYPSAAYWLTDYMVAASLQEAYAAGVAAGQSSAELRDTKPRLIFTSYDPATDTMSPVTRAGVPRLHRSAPWPRVMLPQRLRHPWQQHRRIADQ